MFDAGYNAELYGDVAEILQRDAATYTASERHDLVLAVAAFDPDVREVYELSQRSDPFQPVEMDDTVLLTLEATYGSGFETLNRTPRPNDGSARGTRAPNGAKPVALRSPSLSPRAPI